MRRFLNTAKKRISGRKGMSIAELLFSVLIILLVTSCLTAAVSLAYRQFNRSMQASEAESLASSLRSIMTNELAYTTEIRTDASGSVLSFQSQNYVIDDTSGSAPASAPTTTFLTDGSGRVCIGDKDRNLPLLGDGAYPRGLGAKITAFTYDSGSACFTVTLEIGADGETYYTGTFQVLNVNGVKPQIG